MWKLDANVGDTRAWTTYDQDTKPVKSKALNGKIPPPACPDRARGRETKPFLLTLCNHILSLSFPRFFLPHPSATASSASKVLLHLQRCPSLVPCQFETLLSSCLPTGRQDLYSEAVKARLHLDFEHVFLGSDFSTILRTRSF